MPSYSIKYNAVPEVSLTKDPGKSREKSAIMQGRGQAGCYREVSPTKMKFESGVQPPKPSGFHDISDSFKGTGRP